MKITMRARKSEDGKRYIEGYASLFNFQSRTIHEGGKTFREIIRPGAFDEVLREDSLNTIANIDHDMSRMLGRTTSGTLELTADNRGLRYKIDVPDTQLGNDTYEQVERGDLYESSFAFGVRANNVEWGRDREDGMLLRYVNEVALLRDIAIVRDGAYSNTDVEARSLDYQADVLNNAHSVGEAVSVRAASDFIESLDDISEETREVSSTEGNEVSAREGEQSEDGEHLAQSTSEPITEPEPSETNTETAGVETTEEEEVGDEAERQDDNHEQPETDAEERSEDAEGSDELTAEERHLEFIKNKREEIKNLIIK